MCKNTSTKTIIRLRLGDFRGKFTETKSIITSPSANNCYIYTYILFTFVHMLLIMYCRTLEHARRKTQPSKHKTDQLPELAHVKYHTGPG